MEVLGVLMCMRGREMDPAEALDNFIDYIERHGFLVGFICGAALTAILFVI